MYLRGCVVFLHYEYGHLVLCMGWFLLKSINTNNYIGRIVTIILLFALSEKTYGQYTFEQVDDETPGESYTFADKSNMRSMAIQHGFDLDSPLKGRFNLSFPDREISTRLLPLQVSAKEFKIYHLVNADSFGVSTYTIDELDAVQYFPKNSYYFSSFSRHGSLIWLTSVAVASWAESDLNGLVWYNMWAGLHSLPVLALSGIVASTLPKSYIFDKTGFFNKPHVNNWSFAISVGELPYGYWNYEDYEYVKVDSSLLDYFGYEYWDYEWEKRYYSNLHSIQFQINYREEYSPFTGSINIYHVPLESVAGYSKDEFGLVVYPNIKTSIVQTGQFQSNVSLGLLSQIEFLQDKESAYSKGRIVDDAVRIWGGGELELLYYFLPDVALKISKPIHFFRLENKQPPVFMGIHYSPNRIVKHQQLNFENISIAPVVHTLNQFENFQRKDRNGFGIGINLNFQWSETSRLSYQVLYALQDDSDETEWSYAAKYSKYIAIQNRILLGFSTGIGTGYLYSSRGILFLAGPALELKLTPSVSFFASMEVDALELVYTFLDDNSDAKSPVFVNFGMNIPLFK